MEFLEIGKERRAEFEVIENILSLYIFPIMSF